MNISVIRYHYLIRIVGVLALLLLIGFSEYQQYLGLLYLIVIIYMIYMTLARFNVGIFKNNKMHIYNLFIDVTALSIAISSRGGLRSDFYLGYFLILGYVLFIRNKYLLLKLNAWIVVNYSLFTFFFTEKENFSVGRLIIRLTLIIGTALLLEKYSRMLTELDTLREKAVKMAMFDTLTGAYNRRILDHLNNLFSSEAMLYIVMIDVDNFKTINDYYGHQKGDEVLVALTEVIMKTIGDKNMCIRYGGEEFLIILEENDYANVQKKIQKIQENFRSMQFVWLDRPISFSFTAGISVKNKEEAIEKSIEWADKALYFGKSNGKNCIILNTQIDV